MNANIMIQHMQKACFSEKEKSLLAELLNEHPFAVDDLLNAKGIIEQGVMRQNEQLAGLFVSGYGIYMSRTLLSKSPVVALCTYLHELVHAGAFSNGREIDLHNDEFGELQCHAFGLFGYEPTADTTEYSTRQSVARLTARQPQWTGIAIMLGLIAGAFYTKWVGIADTAEFFVTLGIAAVFMLAEKRRRLRV